MVTSAFAAKLDNPRLFAFMLAAIKNLQIVMHQLMMPISMPENAHIFYSGIIKLLTFDPFPDIDGFYERNFKL